MAPSFGRRQTRATSEMFGINVPWVIRPGAVIARATYFLRPAAALWKESPNVRKSLGLAHFGGLFWPTSGTLKVEGVRFCWSVARRAERKQNWTPR
jgi:hypothetical protein